MAVQSGREKSSLTLDCDIDKAMIARSFTSPESSSAPTSAGDSASPRPYDTLELGHGILEEDKLLASRDKNAVEFVFNYSKLWCKFCKEVVSALEKRAILESDFLRNMSKQFQVLEQSLGSMVGVPLRSETLTFSKQIIDDCKDLETHNNKRLRELLEVLTRQRTEFARTHKYLKDKWKAEVKRFVEAENSLVKTRLSYYQRCQSGVKTREELAQAHTYLNECTAMQGPESQQTVKQRSKVEKLEKQLADNDKKEIELMVAYKEAVDVANARLNDLERSKIEIICDVRLTTMKSDEVFKDTLAEYVQHLCSTRETMLKQYSVLSELMQDYPPCREYRQLLDQYTSGRTEVTMEKYTFEAFHESTTTGGATSSGGSKERLDIPGMGRFSRLSSGGCAESSSPVDFADSDEDTDFSNLGESSGASQSAVLRGDSTPGVSSKGSGMFNTFIEFGSNLFRPMDNKKQSVKNKRSTGEMGAFPVPDVPQNTDRDMEELLPIISRCIKQIEKNGQGIKTQGIYRVPASKVKVSLVMDALATSPEDADLSEELPLTLASVIKTKLISLPEPLLTYQLYPGFVELGKDAENEVTEEHIKRLRSLIQSLGTSNKNLAGLFFHHLKKVADHQSDNQMGSANLGTMFGPTLLRPKAKFRSTNMLEFVDNKPQTRIIELIIDHTEDLFGPASYYYNLPNNQPITASATSTNEPVVIMRTASTGSATTSKRNSGTGSSLQVNTSTGSTLGVGGATSSLLGSSLSQPSVSSISNVPPRSPLLTESQRLTMQKREAFLSGTDLPHAEPPRRAQSQYAPSSSMLANRLSATSQPRVIDLDKINYMDTDLNEDTFQIGGEGDTMRVRASGSFKTSQEQRRLNNTQPKPLNVDPSCQFMQNRDTADLQIATIDEESNEEILHSDNPEIPSINLIHNLIKQHDEESSSGADCVTSDSSKFSAEDSPCPTSDKSLSTAINTSDSAVDVSVEAPIPENRTTASVSKISLPPVDHSIPVIASPMTSRRSQSTLPVKSLIENKLKRINSDTELTKGSQSDKNQ